MKKLFFLILTISAALVFDIFFTPEGNVIPLFVIGAACYWFWRLTLTRRFSLALGIGSLLDVVGFLPMGTHMIIFIVMTYLCEFMKDFFSNNKSRAVIALNIIILMITFRLLVSPASWFTLFAASVI